MIEINDRTEGLPCLYSPSGENVADGILDVNDIEGSRMSLPANNGTNSTQIATSSNHAQVT
jgi:hypothetical protein